MRTIDSFPNRKIVVNEKTKLYFGGTAYLGLQTDKDFQEVFIRNVKKHGTNYGASRKANIEISIFKKAENYLANMVGSESCLTVSSGYLAGQLATHSFNTSDIFYAPNTHSAMHQKGALNFLSYKELQTAVNKHLKNKNTAPVVVFDSIDFFGSNYPLFNYIKKLPLDKIILVADDSHGIGLPLNKGRGCFSLLQQLKPKELIVCTSLGKGFAIQAGAIFASEKRIISLKETALFGGASPATPAGLETIIYAEEIFKKKRAQLKNNIDFFIGKVNNLSKFHYISDHPVFRFTDNRIMEHLASNNIIITSFNYPKKTSPIMNKIVLSAHHKKKDIELVVNLINTL